MEKADRASSGEQEQNPETYAKEYMEQAAKIYADQRMGERIKGNEIRRAKRMLSDGLPPETVLKYSTRLSLRDIQKYAEQYADEEAKKHEIWVAKKMLADGIPPETVLRYSTLLSLRDIQELRDAASREQAET